MIAVEELSAFTGGAGAEDQLLETAVAAAADHRGVRAHLHVRRRRDRSHQVVRHPGPERLRAHDEGDAPRVPREVQCCLPAEFPPPAM